MSERESPIRTPALSFCRYVVGRKLERLTAFIRCAPRLRTLRIQHNLAYARALISNRELCTLLASTLEVFYYKTELAHCSFGDLARLVDQMFSQGTEPARLKELTLNVDGHPQDWISTKHLIRWISKIVKRFPMLIHFTLYCRAVDRCDDSNDDGVSDAYSLTNFAPRWYVLSSFYRRLRTREIEYRCKPHLLDIWL